MRARTVNEAVDFERGIDPKEAMGIGNKGIQIINKLDRLAKKYGLVPAEFGPEHEDEAVINIRRWVLPDIESDDDVEVHLYREQVLPDNPDYWEIFFSSPSGINGNDAVEDWLDDEPWKDYFSIEDPYEEENEEDYDEEVDIWSE